MNEKYSQINLFEFGEELGLLNEKAKDKDREFEERMNAWRKEWKTLDLQNKVYYFGSVATDEYIYSAKNLNGDMFLCFQTNGTILVNECPIQNEDNLLKGREKVCFPAMYIRFLDSNGKEKEDIHYADDDSDDRQKWIIGVWHMDKVSKNRIEEGKKAKNFYEIEFALPDYIEWLKNDIKTRDYFTRFNKGE